MRSVAVCVLGFFVVASSSSDLVACGDKFVIFGQGVRFQRAYAAAHPAKILVYLKPGSKWTTPENRERLLTLLRLVGHRPEAVTTLDELRAAIVAGNNDIVLMERSSVLSTTETIASAKVHPTVVPMVFDPSREEMKEIERQNNCTIAVTRRSHELLTVINDVMEQRIKGVTEGCQRKRA